MVTGYDIVMAPAVFVLLRLVFSVYLRKYQDNALKRRLMAAFYFKMFAAVIFSLISAFYYGGGDTEMYFFATKDMKEAIGQGDLTFGELFVTEQMDPESTLAIYFDQDNEKYPVYGFMRSSSNFLVPKLAVVPAYLFLNSFVAICMVFSFFALGGMIRLYKLFVHYFPNMKSEIALATLFLPSACYWSSGLLKDSICYGSIGFLLYGIYSLLVLRRRMLGSLIWVLLGGYFLYTIKAYILLALVPGICFWLFGLLGAGTSNIALKRVIMAVAIGMATLGGVFLVNYLTSSETLAKFSLDNLLETSSQSRSIYERDGIRNTGAYFEINTSSPALMVVNGLVATFFRPFPWEISSAIVLLSAAESLVFLMLILYLFFKRGLLAPFRKIFSEPILILCFSFSVVFAVSIGVSATNFGSLSRYKIPCLPFYLIFVLASYHLLGQTYPAWFNRILNLVGKKNK
ncbi:MAG: hypothetical protein ACK4E0_01035 [Chitinophagaceae bacterium]